MKTARIYEKGFSTDKDILYLISPPFFLNVAAASTMLIFTSYLDLKKREVPDKVWIIFGAVGVAIQSYEVRGGFTNIVDLALAVGLAAFIGMGIFFAGLYGGADGKALVVLGILLPYFVPNVGIYDIAPLMILTNGILLSMLLPIALLVLNTTRVLRGINIFEGFAEPVHRKILASLLGYRCMGAPKDFQFPMEKVEGSISSSSQTSSSSSDQSILKRRFDFSLSRDDFETTAGTWVTPGIPLLVFFTAGFFVLLFYGDLVIGIVKFLAQIL